MLLTIVVLLSSLSSLTSCKKDKDDDEMFSYSTSTQTTLIKSFALKANAEVLESLDSVHFTIDYDRGQIYNADSLPVGTDISALNVTVEFLNTISSAEFIITDATVQADTTIAYSSSMSKKLDFTGKTILKVTSYDQTQTKDYEVKVLVHKVNPNKLVWPSEWRRDLPGYDSNAMGHKVVKQGDVYRIMVYDGVECQMLAASTPNAGTWSKQTISLPFVPQVPSLTATPDALYVLSTDGTLYASPDGLEWVSCGVTWHSLLGAYGDRVLGVMAGADGYYHDEYPRSADFTATPIEAGFPVSHSSDMIQTDNTWTISQQAMIVGGYDANGQLLRDVWGFDGHHWGKINNIHTRTLPALADATLFPYYTYKALSGVRRYALQETWFVMGGRLADGTLNGKVYLSNTQGITWSQADSTMAMPSEMPKFYGAQAFVNEETLSASGPSYAPGRVSSAVTTWECPFLYLMGGYNGQGDLLPYTWRGVYNRMTNYPVY